MRDKKTGADLYPEFRSRVQQLDPSWKPLSRRLYEAFGVFSATGDGHVGEYFAEEQMANKRISASSATSAVIILVGR